MTIKVIFSKETTIEVPDTFQGHLNDDFGIMDLSEDSMSAICKEITSQTGHKCPYINGCRDPYKIWNTEGIIQNACAVINGKEYLIYQW